LSTGRGGKSPARKNKSRAIIEDDANLFTIDFVCVPIEMHGAEAVISFIPDVGLPASLLLLILFSQIVFEKDLMDSIMRYMPSEFMFDYFFETSCVPQFCSLWISKMSLLSPSPK
jgi:hypothetical protein